MTSVSMPPVIALGSNSEAVSAAVSNILASRAAMEPVANPRAPRLVFLIGVSGSGKTTIGRQLADELGWDFHDADDFHPATNVEKMKQGIPLTDEDRAPWLDRIAAFARELMAAERRAVFACSALKQRYRDRLRVDDTVRFVLLDGPPELLRARIESRHHHFMPESLLESQLDALEPPGPDVLRVDVEDPPGRIVQEIRGALGL